MSRPVPAPPACRIPAIQECMHHGPDSARIINISPSSPTSTTVPASRASCIHTTVSKHLGATEPLHAALHRHTSIQYAIHLYPGKAALGPSTRLPAPPPTDPLSTEMRDQKVHVQNKRDSRRHRMIHFRGEHRTPLSQKSPSQRRCPGNIQAISGSLYM